MDDDPPVEEMGIEEVRFRIRGLLAERLEGRLTPEKEALLGRLNAREADLLTREPPH